jgi:hypothetical protein
MESWREGGAGALRIIYEGVWSVHVILLQRAGTGNEFKLQRRVKKIETAMLWSSQMGK